VLGDIASFWPDAESPYNPKEKGGDETVSDNERGEPRSREPPPVSARASAEKWGKGPVLADVSVVHTKYDT